MKRRRFLKVAGSMGAAAIAGAWGMLEGCASSPERRESRRPPNLVLVLADDLGYAQLGCFGERRIKTPCVDRMAAEGVRLTQVYSGSPVCAPSRCVLLTGLHTGHAPIRDNHEIKPEGQEPLPDGTITLPGLLKRAGYATAAIGKWGLGYSSSSGEPRRQGFDLFFGYLCQRHAHNYYPAYVWRNQERVPLEGNDSGLTGAQYVPDLCESEALDFIRAHADRPFFLFYSTTLPHLALQVPRDSLAEYEGLWPETPYDGSKGYLPHRTPRAAYAAMVSRLDRSVGRILALLEQLHLEEDTLVLFTSDNGSTYDVGGYDMEFFKGAGPFRSHKGYVHEGGIRVPLVARWPGRIPAGRTNDHVCAFQDLLPTFLDSAGAPDLIPVGLDGLSFLPALTASGIQEEHEFLYMEFPAYGGQQMVRLGDWKGVRQGLAKEPDAPIELFDLASDPGETRDVSALHPDVIERMTKILREQHDPSKVFPFPALDGDR